MPNVVTCACQMRLDVSQRVAGQVVTCPACGQPHTIQAPRPVIFDDLPPHVPPAKTGSRQGQQITPHTPPESPFRLALFSFLLVVQDDLFKHNEPFIDELASPRHEHVKRTETTDDVQQQRGPQVHAVAELPPVHRSWVSIHFRVNLTPSRKRMKDD